MRWSAVFCQMFVAPAAFHIIGYLVGFGLDRPVRILSSLFSGE